MTPPFAYPADPHARRHGPRCYADYAVTGRGFGTSSRSGACTTSAGSSGDSSATPSRSTTTSPRQFGPTSPESTTILFMRVRPATPRSLTGRSPIRARLCYATTFASATMAGLKPTRRKPAGSSASWGWTTPSTRSPVPLDRNCGTRGAVRSGSVSANPGLPRGPAGPRALNPPGGNARPEGVSGSHHQRQMRGELPSTY